MKQRKATARPAEPTADRLLAWYDRHARRLPWRVGPDEVRRGAVPDPYRVWLSEIMLQQTTVAAVKPYFETFLRRWPTVFELAAANRDDIMRAWAGLGYYARARRMKACAEIVVTEMGGVFPATAVELQNLPGLGPYTAAAIAAIAYGEPAVVVDGNVERVLSRLYAVDTPLPAAKPFIRDLQERLTPRARAGDYAQAVMDLGATICTRSRPACGRCPWSDACVAFQAGTAEAFPVRAPRKRRPVRHGAAFVVTRADGALLLRRRPETGLLGGMAEVPGTDWTAAGPDDGEEVRPKAGNWRRITGTVRHVFTHFSLELTVWHGLRTGRPRPPRDHWWSPPGDIGDEALPSVMKKVVEAALPGATKQHRDENGAGGAGQ